MHPDELVFVPLGGAGEIGMNLNLYGYGNRWIMIDLGVTFSDDGPPGADVIMPDPKFIEARRENLIGLILTHAHEDHIGAVQYLWPRLRCPIWATPFTASVLRRKLSETQFGTEVPITEVPLSGRISLPPFEIEFVSITHSIPEPNCIVLRTPVGTVLHTGDWKIDPDPLVGVTTDDTTLRRLGDEGVLACICDSTNALRTGHSGSEADVRESLVRLISGRKGRVAVSCFASNIARIASIAFAAKESGRYPVLSGRSLHRMVQAARETGYLDDEVKFIDEGDSSHLARSEVLYICTGSQGEPRASLAKLAAGSHPVLELGRGDTVIFSSRVIPGNERAIARIQNGLLRQGIELITEADHFVHVSGHPARDELAELYQWIRPRIAIPVHGERLHLEAHAELARDCQIPEALVVENGMMIRLAPGPAEIIDEVPAGRLALDGNRLIVEGSIAWRDRNRVAFNGAVVATLIMDGRGKLKLDPVISLQGVIDPENDFDLHEVTVEAVKRAVEKLPESARQRDDGAVKEAVRLALRRVINARCGKKPLTDVQVCRV